MERQYRDLIKDVYDCHGVNASDAQIFNIALQHDIMTPDIKRVRAAIETHHTAVMDYSDSIFNR